MKKTLITIVLFLCLTLTAFTSVRAEELSVDIIPEIYNLSVDNEQVTFTTTFQPVIDYLIIEYTYFEADMLMSTTEYISIIDGYCTIGTDEETLIFNLPEEALSFKIWRVVTDESKIYSTEGENEYTKSTLDSISNVDLRIMTAYIVDDLVTRESVMTSMGSWLELDSKFRLHFNLEDESGVEIPVDRITSLTVEYDVVTSYLIGGDTTRHVVKEIEETFETKTQYYPFYIPSYTMSKIYESSDSNYSWCVDLGTYEDPDSWLPTSSVTLDLTTVLTISYYFDGVFYDDVEVIDEPFEAEDVIDVIPNTTIELQDIWTALEDFIDKSTVAFVIIAVIVLVILVLTVLSFLSKILSLIKAIASLVWKSLKLIWKIGVFIFWTLPKSILKGLWFLITPKERRKESRQHAYRHI